VVGAKQIAVECRVSLAVAVKKITDYVTLLGAA